MLVSPAPSPYPHRRRRRRRNPAIVLFVAVSSTSRFQTHSGFGLRIPCFFSCTPTLFTIRSTALSNGWRPSASLYCHVGTLRSSVPIWRPGFLSAKAKSEAPSCSSLFIPFVATHSGTARGTASRQETPGFVLSIFCSRLVFFARKALRSSNFLRAR